jgi:hypothetical protein
MIKFLKPNGSIILTVSDDVALFSERLRYLHSKLILKNINNKNNLNFAKKIFDINRVKLKKRYKLNFMDKIKKIKRN